MPENAFVSIKMEFRWDQKSPVLQAIFDASKNLCTKSAAKIILDYSVGTNVEQISTRLGLVYVTLTNAGALEILYREMIEKNKRENCYLWKHETFVYTISKYLTQVEETSHIFSNKMVNSRCTILNDGDYIVLDESGVLIKSPYKSNPLISFDITTGMESAIIKILEHSLKEFEKYKPNEE